MRDTTIIERNLTTGKRRTFSMAPYCVILIVLALLVAMVVVLGTADRAAKTVAAKSKYDVISPEPMPVISAIPVLKQPVPATFQHVILRVGKWEIFRFTYEEANGVREGDS